MKNKRQSHTDGFDFLWYDRRRKAKLHHQEKMVRVKRKLNLVGYSSLAICLAVFTFSGFALSFPVAASNSTVAPKEEEPSIPTPRVDSVEIAEVEPQTVQVVSEINWTEERIIKEIHKVFPDAPIMVHVAKCEGVTNGKLDPEAFNPTNNSNDKGIFQISERYHAHAYPKYGLSDMFDVRENLAYARVLYDRNGLRDWGASQHCWSKHL